MRKKIFAAAAVIVLTLMCALSASAATTTSADGNWEYEVLGDGTIKLTDFSGGTDSVNVTVPSEVDGKKVSSIEYAFYANNDIKSVEIAEGITDIGDGAFGYCESLESVMVPNSVTSIGISAFEGCESLKSIDLSQCGITAVADSVFYSCSALTSVNLPETVTYIDELAFSECTALSGITIPEAVTSIGNRAFSQSGLTSVTIPKNVTYMGDAWMANTFSECTELKSATVLCDVTSDDMFEGCTSLSDVKLKGNITHMSYGMFEECTSLKSIEVPKTVEVFGNCVFNGCTALETVTVPKSISSDDSGAGIFDNCNNIKDVYFYEGEAECEYAKSMVSAQSYHYYTQRALAAQTTKNSETDCATGFTATINCNNDDKETIKKIRWRITDSDGTEKIYDCELENEIKFDENKKSAIIGIVIDGLFDSGATAVVSTN